MTNSWRKSHLNSAKVLLQKPLTSSHIFSSSLFNPHTSPTPELKPLPLNLKYAYLDDRKSFPVIISASLTDEQEEKLLSVLKKHKKAIGWTLVDIPGISSSTCMHQINLQDGAKPVRQP